MATAEQTLTSNSGRSRPIAAAGVFIILLGVGTAVLPVVQDIRGPMLGWLLFAAGVTELLTGLLRRAARIPAILAGAATSAAGLLFIINPLTKFFPTLNIVAFWLIVRSLILAVAAMRLKGNARMWTAIAAATDFLLGLILVAGLSISTLVVGVFGPTPAVVASFSWVLALSFVATGIFLLEISSCEASD